MELVKDATREFHNKGGATMRLAKYILSVLCMVALLMLPAQQVMAQETGDEQVEQGTVFQITGLTVEPNETSAGEAVTVRADVTNAGDVEGSYTANLEINGNVEASEDITLTAGETTSVEFSYTPPAEGDYTITIGDQAASLRVTAAAEAKFREGPVVRLRPVCDQIDSSRDGLVELFFANSSLNEVTMHGDFYVSVPAGIYVYGQGMGLATAAGTTYGQFTATPGTARTIYLNIKADETAAGKSYFIHFSGQYYIDGNKDAYQPISLTHPFKVLEASPEPGKPAPTDPDQIPNPEPGGIWIGWWIIIGVVMLGGIATIVAARSR